jgi:hypothetical protein
MNDHVHRDFANGSAQHLKMSMTVALMQQLAQITSRPYVFNPVVMM